MKVSVLSYSFRRLLQEGTMDVFGYLETCKYRYGLDHADIWHGFLQSTDDEYLSKVRNALDERELELVDLCVDKAHVWDDDEAVREQNYQNALANLRAAKTLGARFVRIDAGSRRAEWSSQEFDHIVKRYKEYCDFAADNGFKMGAENHWGPEKSWKNLKALIDAVDHPAFGISCHLNSWEGTQEEKDEADRLVAPYVCHTHFSLNITEGPLEEKMKILRDAGYQGSYSAEYYKTEDEYNGVGKMLDDIRAVIAGWRVAV